MSTAASRSTFALGAVRCQRCGHSMHGYTVSTFFQPVISAGRFFFI